MIKTVFFDLDDTLLDFRKAEAAAVARVLREAGIEPTEAVVQRYHELNIAQWELLEEGKLTREQVLLRRFDLLFEELGVVRSSREICDRYEGYLGQGHFFIPGAPEVLKQLAPKYDLYLASNGSAAVQRVRLESAGIRGYFKDMFVSENMRANKPSLAFFEACFAAIPDFSRETAIIVGDSLTSDIRGGIGAGIRTCWFNPHGKPQRPDIVPDCQIESLTQLPALVETL